MYAPGRYFACRQCGRLGYATQKAGAGDRALTNAGKIRKRLGWEAGIANGDGAKPKGMHWKTYNRMRMACYAQSTIALAGMAEKLGMVQVTLARIKT